MPFTKAVRPQDPSTDVVGLVPCAVGGTAIKEWERPKLTIVGESDTSTQHDDDTYKANMERFIHNVAIISGDKMWLEKVRESQLRIDMPNVVCVDAKGLELKEDNLHLTTEAQVKLGNMLADAYLRNFVLSLKIMLNLEGANPR
ncbi:hypothetical protein MKX01_022392 [Papaver californicum]|nr:hypothetical protein MKX01_022392 [Papaver californicum]